MPICQILVSFARSPLLVIESDIVNGFHKYIISFSTSAKVEIFSLDLGTPGPEMTLVGAIDTPNRLEKCISNFF